MSKNKKNKKGKGIIKKWIKKIHLWFGLFIGILILIISLTGALYVFKDDIENITRKEYIYHREKNIDKKEVLPIRKLEKLVNAQVREKYPLHWVNIPIDSQMSYMFYWYEHNDNAWNYFDEFPLFKLAYVNPYNGKVLKVYDEKNGFFNIVKMIHWSFLFKMEWGKYLVGIPVILFVLMLISGIILWWPKNKAARQQRFWFKWKNIKNWKRKNYDLHNILGFYSSIFALVLTITGLFYSFLIVQTFIYTLFSGGKTEYPDFSHIKTSADVEMRTDITLNNIIDKVKELYPQSHSFSLDLGHPHMDHHEHPNFQVFVKHLAYSYHKNSSLIFDENSGELLHVHNPENKNFGEKVVAANYDIHVGSILGLPTKIIAFIVSLMIASMPITGFLIWRGRNKKNKSKKNKAKQLDL
ncbi:PepSY-associated TM helix domain-containing protein [Apibacter raozihei]|uniref:PepSY-associated TM helix domain-containing protein n=1 Tax=Apibacter raozihei TaxID=2500547 RepID=UPI000FE3C317|nr:PepSY-associated TM helix domain-containing protein [Apibacter raozihei]